jgi:putative oxidoreductase
MVHLPNGFFMNWSGQQKGEGVEFFFLAIGIAIAIMMGGGGAFSIDRILTSKDQGQLNRTSA